MDQMNGPNGPNREALDPCQLAHHLGEHLGLVEAVKVPHRDANDGNAALERARANGVPVDLERAVVYGQIVRKGKRKIEIKYWCSGHELIHHVKGNIVT